jgi:tetratricopeptide (TPR) repeat protein
LDPQVHTNWYHRGHAYITLAQWDKAAADFTRIIEGWPADMWGWYFRGGIYAQMNRPGEAVADLRQAIAKGFKDPAGMRSDARFEPLRANVEFKKLLADLETRFRPALSGIERAVILRDGGELDEAIQVCSEILAQKPDNVAAWLERANCYLRKGAFTEAIEDYTHVIQVKPDNGWAWHERGYCYLMLGQHAKAIVDHSKSIELSDHDAGQHLRRGHSYRALGQLQQAEEDYSRAIELNPTYWENWYARARLYAQQHNAEKARSDLASMMKLPMDPGAQNSIAWRLSTDRDASWRNPALAVELAEKAIAARPTDGMIWNTLGVARYRRGQWKEAIAVFEKSMQFRNGGDCNDWFFLGMSYWQLGDKQAARKWYDQAISWMEKNRPRSTQLIRFRDEAKALLAPATQPATNIAG